MKHLLASLLLLSCWTRSFAADALAHREWKMGEVAREAEVYVPAGAKEKASPVIFVFHGHGGRAELTAKHFRLHELWPEAIVVYPQGVNTPGLLTDKEGKKAGWQIKEGQENDRDLKFFDAMLASLKQDYRVDEKRIYATGHSNGGVFTYFLWATRGDVFAAVAPTAAMIPAALNGKFKPKPALHLAGETDPLVKYEWQQATMKTIREINQCGEGKPWGDLCTRYESKIGAPVVTYIHPGAHGYPDAASPVIAKFFKEQVKQ